MSLRKFLPWALALGACACAGPEKNPVVDQPAPLPAGTVEPGESVKGEPAKAAPAPAPAAKPDAPPSTAAADLPRRAFALSTHGDALAALDLLGAELAARVRAGDWSRDSVTAESVVAAWLARGLVERFDRWKDAAGVVDALAPLPAGTPPELAFALADLQASALRALGRPSDARAITTAQGAVSDWMIIGPFDNERGGGFDTKFVPEEHIDLALPVRGKERDVSWRKNPGADHPLARVVLEPMFRPSQQVCAYLATAIESDADRDVVLHLGSSCAVKVILNGHTALARKVRRPFHPEQDEVVLPLARGTNQLLVKLAVEDWPEWVFFARLTDLAGRPLPGGVDSSKVADATLAWRESAAQPAPSARDVLAAAKDDAELARMLALLLLELKPEDVGQNADKLAAEHALALAPDDVQGRYLLALACAPETGISRDERQVNPQLFALRATLEVDPDHTGALLDLADFYARENPIPTRVGELTEKALKNAPRSWRAVTTRMGYCAGHGLAAEADALMRRLFELPEARDLPATVLAHVEQLVHTGDPAGALVALEEGFERRCLPGGVYDRLVAAYIDAGALDRAQQACVRLVAGSPFNVQAMLSTARLIELSGDIAASRAWCERALAVGPENTDALLALARLAVRDGDLATADTLLGRVTEIDPGYDKARRQRALLAAQDQDPFEKAWRKDGIEIVKAAGPLQSSENEPVEALARTSVYRVRPDGTEANYEHLILRALNLGGIKALARYTIAYPDDAILQVYNLRVIRPDGSFERAPAPGWRDQSSGGWRYRAFDLPPLSLGDSIEIEYRVDETEPDVFGEYFGLRYEFYPDWPDPLAPTRSAELVVISPADVPLYTSEQNAEHLEKSVDKDSAGLTVRRWLATDLRRPSLESGMPRRSEFAPGVEVTTYASWDDFGKWWWNFIEKEFVTTPEMKAKVQELTAGLTTEHDKVQAIARFVGQEIRYNAWPFGTHGYEPYSTATIFERRFGDCKDKSILLKQMLAEIGVRARPVLLMAEYYRPKEPLAVAMVGYFNHCIAWLPETKDRPGYYLDATADRNPLDYLRADDQGAHVLRVDEEGGALHEIPYAPPDDNALKREYAVVLDAQGDGQVRMQDDSNGMFGVQMRYQFGGEKGDLKKRIAAALADAFGQVDVSEVDTSALENIGVPARLTTSFAARNLWTREQGSVTLRLAFDPLGLENVAVESPADRHFDLVLDRPFEIATRATYTLPRGAKVEDLPPKAKVAAEGLVSYELDVRAEGDQVVVERRFQLLDRRISLARYAEFRNALQEIRQAEERTIRVAPPPPAVEGARKPEEKKAGGR